MAVAAIIGATGGVGGALTAALRAQGDFEVEAFSRTGAPSLDVTDEASAIEALGLKPTLVEGSPRNFKVTLPQDVLLAELYIKGIA
jgi:uncharacterized protein YbjT (DUF2867 family)